MRTPSNATGALGAMQGSACVRLGTLFPTRPRGQSLLRDGCAKALEVVDGWNVAAKAGVALSLKRTVFSPPGPGKVNRYGGRRDSHGCGCNPPLAAMMTTWLCGQLKVMVGGNVTAEREQACTFFLIFSRPPRSISELIPT